MPHATGDGQIGDLLEDVVVVGGLVPTLIVPLTGDRLHVGPVDLDVGLSMPLIRSAWHSDSPEHGVGARGLPRVRTRLPTAKPTDRLRCGACVPALRRRRPARLPELPLSLRLIREIHAELMQGVRGQERQPGDFRTSQNWIGASGSTLATAAFVPPAPHRLGEALSNLERFLHDEQLPPLVQAAIAHAQFETIHPFLDGNGRVGRLLITFLLCHRGVLGKPLLYLSHYLKQHRAEYYDRLQAVRLEGRWEEWITFFLRGVSEVARSATDTARRITTLREENQRVLQAEGKASGNLLRALDVLFESPVVTVRLLEQRLKVTFATANSVASRLVELGVLRERTGYARNRRFVFEPYLALFEADGTVSAP